MKLFIYLQLKSEKRRKTRGEKSGAAATEGEARNRPELKLVTMETSRENSGMKDMKETEGEMEGDEEVEENDVNVSQQQQKSMILLGIQSVTPKNKIKQVLISFHFTKETTAPALKAPQQMFHRHWYRLGRIHRTDR